ncbi:hypothetical protein NLI96_g13212 [Meripilus lineatus]|uniref:Uncharacterized protein n=1 Tax=Meripilus lineatus TaxID=2056292 RepID=A0AAD5UNF4_9APHY|nr:hypothetical protein NLI96_g13212 [Physisporinus lineatus]
MKYKVELMGLSLPERTQRARKEYNQLVKGIPPSERRLALAGILEELDRWDNENEDAQSQADTATHRMNRAIDQFTQLSNAYRNLEDIVVGGFVMYLGESLEARALSRFWAGSDMGRMLLDANSTKLRMGLDLLTASCWSYKYTGEVHPLPFKGYKSDEPEDVPLLNEPGPSRSNRWESPGPVYNEESDEGDQPPEDQAPDDQAPDDQPPILKRKENPKVAKEKAKPKSKRDELRSQMSTNFTRQLNECLGQKPNTKITHGFQYVAWIEIAREKMVRFVNWPAGIECGCPGPNFYHRGLNIASLQAIFEAGAKVVRWTDHQRQESAGHLPCDPYRRQTACVPLRQQEMEPEAEVEAEGTGTNLSGNRDHLTHSQPQGSGR